MLYQPRNLSSRTNVALYMCSIVAHPQVADLQSTYAVVADFDKMRDVGSHVYLQRQDHHTHIRTYVTGPVVT